MIAKILHNKAHVKPNSIGTIVSDFGSGYVVRLAISTLLKLPADEAPRPTYDLYLSKQEIEIQPTNENNQTPSLPADKIPPSETESESLDPTNPTNTIGYQPSGACDPTDCPTEVGKNKVLHVESQSAPPWL